LIQRLQSLTGVQRQLVIGLTWLAAALYALAPAVPQQYMPMMAMAGMDHAGMHHDMPHAMAAMPDDCGMDAADMPGPAADAKPSHAASHECPICKVAATAMVLATPPALPNLTPDTHADDVTNLWLPPSQRVLSAQPRGPPSQV